MSELIDAAGAIALLERAVAEKGADYVYPESEKQTLSHFGPPLCVYFTEGRQPLCIVGHVLAHMGKGPADVIEGAGIRGFGVDWFTKRALSVLASAQFFQDSGYTWGRALEQAKRRA